MQHNFQQKKLIVIGGGAAGFFCAVNAARLHPHLQVVMVEKSHKLLSKVKISGGGRCNVTHACNSIGDMVKNYPRGHSFLKKAFHQFFTTDTIEWFQQRNVSLKTEPDGRMFPQSNTSQTIIDCLLYEAQKYKVEVLLQTEVCSIKKINNQFEIAVKGRPAMVSEYVCIACGGYPKSSQFQWLSLSGHSIQPPVPSLFTFNIPQHSITTLMGITVPNVTVKIAGTKFMQKGPLLVTHWGLSGPAVLKLSAWAARELSQKNYEFTILINWAPDYNENTLREKLQQLRFSIAAQKIYNKNIFELPVRLWNYLLQQCSIHEEMRWADLPAKEQNKLIKILTGHEILVKGKTTFKEEFVTSGGISLAEIDVNTMQSKKINGLYFAGEILDVDGVTGGFNFQNAWTTGWIAANSIGR